MLVVSNTSPICNLAIIGRLELLKKQFGKVCLPSGVEMELRRLSNPVAATAVQQALIQGWLEIKQLSNNSMADRLSGSLDRGEAEAIAMGLELQADLVLLDERDGRMAASGLGLKVTGVLGIILRAKLDREIPAIKPELAALRNTARFFVSPRLERQILDAAGE